ncbi:MAG: peptide ABC transporter substrate-binding protein [Anaerolineales bacterium]|nr:peptide ABC transporter substrate-binding protein [Anaerolineales bacterium]
MGRHIRWQAILTFTGIAMTMAFLGFLAFSRTSVIVPDVGGTYTEGIAGVPQFINPLLSQYNQVDQDLSALIFNGLTRFNGQGELEPDLARSWSVSDDGLVYVFKLRNGTRWQDNKPLTAADVIFTIGLMQDPDFPGVPYLGHLWRTVTVEQLDEYTIRFSLTEPFPAFADFTTIGILPEHLLADMSARELLNHPFNLKPVGTGPFKLDEINTEFARLLANPLYFGPKPRLTQVELRFYPNYQESIAAYQAGTVQAISFIPPQAIPAVQAIDSLNLYIARLSGYEIIYLNLQDPANAPFFQEVEVRQALMMALDRQAIIDQALHGQGLLANGPIRPWSWAYNPDQPVINFDPAKATALLDQAGWRDSDGDGLRDKDGRTLAFNLLTSDDPDRIKVAEAASKQWRQVGIGTSVEVVGAGLGDRLARHQFQAALAEVLLTGDPDPYPFWHQAQIEGGQNYAGWSNDAASMLLEQARTVTDKGRRNDFYFEFQRIFAEELPSLILFHPVYTYGVSREVHEVQLAPMVNPSDRFRTIANWYLLTRRVVNIEGPNQNVAPPQ